MSAQTASNTKTIYVELLVEGTTVVRPTQGEALSGDVYRLLPTPDYDPEDESWEFLPGSIVRCAKEIWDNEEVLVARELVSDAVRKLQSSSKEQPFRAVHSDFGAKRDVRLS